MLTKTCLLIGLICVVIVSVICSFVIFICCNHRCETFKYVCFPSCKKLLNVLLLAIDSFTKHNNNLYILVFNNNELDNDDVNKILANMHGNNKLYIINISPWMDIFKDCKPLKGQLNNYIRLLMPLVFRCYFPNVHRFMYCDENSINYYRSWTGIQIFKAYYKLMYNEYIIYMIEINNNKEEYNKENIQNSIDLFKNLIKAECKDN